MMNGVGLKTVGQLLALPKPAPPVKCSSKAYVFLQLGNARLLGRVYDLDLRPASFRYEFPA